MRRKAATYRQQTGEDSRHGQSRDPRHSTRYSVFGSSVGGSASSGISGRDRVETRIASWFAVNTSPCRVLSELKCGCLLQGSCWVQQNSISASTAHRTDVNAVRRERNVPACTISRPFSRSNAIQLGGVRSRLSCSQSNTTTRISLRLLRPLSECLVAAQIAVSGNQSASAFRGRKSIDTA